MDRKRPLDADAERALPHGERLADAGPLTLDDDALEDLDSPALALDDLEVNPHGISGLEGRKTVAQLASLEDVDRIGHEKGGPEPATHASGTLVPLSETQSSEEANRPQIP